jgi:hypothetical protein
MRGLSGFTAITGWLAENEQDEMIAKAEAAIKLAIKLEPNSPGAHVVPGNVLRAKGQFERAIEASGTP